MNKREQTISFIGVIILALILPGLLRVANNIVRTMVGAEGRLSAIAVETDHPLGPLPRPWQALAQGGDEITSFLDDPATVAKVSQIKPDYIRVDHIYDQFGVVTRQNGKLIFDWSQLDRVVNQIKLTGAKPFFALSYMPPDLASGDVTSEPKNWQEWSLVVQKTIEHYSGQTGMDNVYYEVWNEPDLFGKWKMGGNKDYKTLYSYSAAGANAAENTRPFKFGGPATTGLYRNWIDSFFPFILQNRLRLDFISWHRYDLDTDKYAEDIQNVDRWIESHPYFSQVEKIITETAASNEPGKDNDTQAGAAQLVAATREMIYKVKYGFNFAVSGKWGIVGKPRYNALQMLGGLGDQRIAVTGEGSWVKAIAAQSGNKYQVLLVNFDPKQSHTEIVPVTFLSLKGSNYTLKKDMGGIITNQDIATSEGMLQVKIPMQANNIVMLELEEKANAISPTLSPPPATNITR